MKNKKLIIAIVALVVVVALLLGVYFLTRPEPKAGDKEITVTVVYEDGASKDFVYQTDAEYLGTVLVDEGLVEGETTQYGLYIIAVDGVSAVWEETGAYWAINVGDQPAVTGADQIVIEDGGIYSLVYTVG